MQTALERKLAANRERNRRNYWEHHDEEKVKGREKREKYYYQHRETEKAKALARYYVKTGRQLEAEKILAALHSPDPEPPVPERPA